STPTPPPYLLPLSLHDALPIFPPYTQGLITWFQLLQPYLSSTNVLLCPSRKDKPLLLVLWDGIPVTAPTVSDFAINHQFAGELRDRKSTRLNSSHVAISYGVFC